MRLGVLLYSPPVLKSWGTTVVRAVQLAMDDRPRALPAFAALDFNLNHLRRWSLPSLDACPIGEVSSAHLPSFHAST